MQKTGNDVANILSNYFTNCLHEIFGQIIEIFGAYGEKRATLSSF